MIPAERRYARAPQAEFLQYTILRHNGVDLGKIDYIGSLPTREG